MYSLARIGIVLLVLTLLITPQATTRAHQAAYIATLDPAQGLIQLQHVDDDPQDITSWQTITQRTPVVEGDRIRTDHDGLAYLRFFAGVETQIGPSTLVVVSTLALPEDEPFDITLDLLVGSTLSTVDAVLDADDRFEIHTPGATALVRGTRWQTVVLPDGRVVFQNMGGLVNVIPHLRPVMAAPPPTPTATGLPPTGGAGGPAATSPPPTSTPPTVVAVAPPPADDAAEPAAVPDAAPAWAANYAAVYQIGEGRRMALDGAGLRFELDRLDFVTAPRSAPLAAADCGDGVCKLRERRTCPVDCPDALDLRGCGNGRCELRQGEDLLVCPQDCRPWDGAACGDGTCAADESGLTCPADCAPGQYFAPVGGALCGDGTCDPTESALNCPQDCRRSR
jgi:hypothetical protein